MRRLSVVVALCSGLGLVGCGDEGDTEGPESADVVQAPENDGLVVELGLIAEFEPGREEAVAVYVVDGFRFEIGMRIEDYEELVADGETSIRIDLDAPEYSEVSVGGELQRVEGSPLLAAAMGDETICADSLVRAYYLGEAALVADVSHASVEPLSLPLVAEQGAAASADVIYSSFNKCDRFVGWDGECGGKCGKYRLWVNELWGEYSYGNCVPAGDYWLSGCKCEGPYGPWTH